ncbi:MAG TPA: putative porin [Candidatus Omnitrophota bacterium]|nr:putative porin [Candidatus Omnitrophota bacterium]
MRKAGIVCAMLLMFLLPSTGPAFGGAGMAAESQVDKLVAKLVQKGILTTEEAMELKQEVALEAKQGTGAAQQSVKSEVPEWVQNTRLTGDFRVRNQLEHRRTEGPSEVTRDRVRMRARLGLETKVNDRFKMAVGIATDGGSARSTNQTFDSNFAKGNVALNYAYGQYIPNDQWTLTGGQMKNPIWEPMEFLWDSDITPTGGAAQYHYKLSDALNVFALGSGFVVKELIASSADPVIYVGQLGVKGKLSGGKTDYKLAGAYQYFANNSKVTLQSSANNTIAASQYTHTYHQPMGFAEIGINDPLGKGFRLHVPRVAVFGEFVHNPDPADENNAWMIGTYFGNSTVADKGAWKATWAYKSLGRDAWLDVLPDSDFYGGATDSQGYEAVLEYGLAKNVTVAVDYYHTRRKSSLAAPAQESLLQTDINLKF